jgi:alpha-tubulin suppressor-like RCC1 family protein
MLLGRSLQQKSQHAQLADSWCLSPAKRGKDAPVEEVTEPKQCLLISDCTKVACGAEFTMWLCGDKLYAAGSPQSGQLGDGSDHSCNVKDSSIKIMHEPRGVPQRVPGLSGVDNVACGVAHTIAVTGAGECYTWGSGDYGRLGHKVQQARSCSSPRVHCLPLQGVDTMRSAVSSERSSWTQVCS